MPAKYSLTWEKQKWWLIVIHSCACYCALFAGTEYNNFTYCEANFLSTVSISHTFRMKSHIMWHQPNIASQEKVHLSKNEFSASTCMLSHQCRYMHLMLDEIQLYLFHFQNWQVMQWCIQHSNKEGYFCFITSSSILQLPLQHHGHPAFSTHIRPRTEPRSLSNWLLRWYMISNGQTSHFLASSSHHLP